MLGRQENEQRCDTLEKEAPLRLYIHIGGTYAISDKYILGIFDFDGTTQPGSATIEYLRKAEQNNRAEAVSPDLPRSFVVTLDRVFYSPITAATIRRRMNRSGQAIENGSWLHESEINESEENDTDDNESIRKVKE